MASMSQSTYYGGERDFLEGLRARYEAEGFSFTVSPDPSMLPAFLGGYRPDAIAEKPEYKVAIEVKNRSSLSSHRQVQDIRRLFEGHPDWRFHVVFTGSGPSQLPSIPSASWAEITKLRDDVQQLTDAAHNRAALLMAWSLLEAVANFVGGEAVNRPRSTASVVEMLAMNGLISPETERKLRPLAALRNRIAHGVVSADATRDDVQCVQSAVEEVLSSAQE